MKVQDLVDQGKEKKNARNPLVSYQVDKAAEMIELSKRKGILHDEKGYNRAREAFEQNYKKLHPYKPSV